MAAQIDPLWLAAMVIILLCVDLFVAVPTLTITLLSGFFLGFPAGAMAAFTGMSLAAFGGYVICRLWGEGPVAFLVRDEAERLEMKEAFQRNGPVMILIPTTGKNDPYDRTFGGCGKELMPSWSG